MDAHTFSAEREVGRGVVSTATPPDLANPERCMAPGSVFFRGKNVGAQHAAPLPCTMSAPLPHVSLLAVRHHDRFDIAGTTRIFPSISATRSAAIPRTQPIASAIATRIAPFIANVLNPIAR